MSRIAKHLSLTTLLLILWVNNSVASLIFDADFATAGQGYSHYSFFIFQNLPDPGPQSTVGGSTPGGIEGRWTASYEETPSTDFFFNRFQTVGGAMRIEDWGGAGQLESFAIDVSTHDQIDIAGINAVLGAGANEADEYFRFFYSLDGGARVYEDFSSGGSYSVDGLNVSGASTLRVGFEFNVDGSSGFFQGDGWTVGQLSVTAVPEPSTYAAMGMALVVAGWMARRRRQRRELELDLENQSDLQTVES